jgi:hypothetical protein
LPREIRRPFNLGDKKKELEEGNMAKRKAAVPLERVEETILYIRVRGSFWPRISHDCKA